MVVGILFVTFVVVAVGAGTTYLLGGRVDPLGVSMLVVFGLMLLSLTYVLVVVIWKKGKAFFNFLYGLLIGVPFFIGIGGGVGAGVGYLLEGVKGMKIGGGLLGLTAFILGIKCCIGLAREARPKQMKG